MQVIRHSGLEAIESPGGNASSAIATPRHGASAVSVIRQRQEPGGHNPPHHHDVEEILLLQRGAVSITVADSTVELSAGDTLIVPALTVHQISNSGAEVAEWLLIAPAGVRFFRPDGEELTPAWTR
jgi:quercetin dioxygenase-like cupin family protein